MSVKKKSLLPGYVLKNETINDIFNAVDAEFELIEEHLEKIKNELNMATANNLLSRYEDIFELPTVGARKERIFKLLSKVNMQMSATVPEITAFLEQLSKRKVKIIEFFSEYRFDVFITILPEDNARLLDILFDQIETVKPAHLQFRLVANTKLLSFKNTDRERKSAFKFGLKNYNSKMPGHYLNGVHKLDGSYQLNQAFVGSLDLYLLRISTSFNNKHSVRIIFRNQ